MTHPTDTSAVEAVARALCKHNRQDPDSVELNTVRWTLWAKDAEVAITAYRSTLGEKGQP